MLFFGWSLLVASIPVVAWWNLTGGAAMALLGAYLIGRGHARNEVRRLRQTTCARPAVQPLRRVPSAAEFESAARWYTTATHNHDQPR